MAESSRCLEFPEELSTVLAAISGQSFAKPVWTLCKQKSGYSLKVFWKSQLSGRTPIDPHSHVATKRSRSHRRMDSFLAQKRSTSSLKPPEHVYTHERQSFDCLGSGIPETCKNEAVETTDLIQALDNSSDDCPTDQPGITEHLEGMDAIPEPPKPSLRSSSSSASSVPSQPISEPAYTGHTDSTVCEPVAKRTRSHGVADAQPITHSCLKSVDRIPALSLASSIKDITMHHIDYVWCEDAGTAELVKGKMKVQWSSLVFPGRKVKIKIQEELVDGEVDKCYYISRLSYDCRYFYATAKVDIKVISSGLTKEFQFRDLYL